MDFGIRLVPILFIRLSVTKNYEQDILKTNEPLMRIGNWSAWQEHETINFKGQEVKD